MIKYYSQQIYLKLGFLAHSTKSESIVVIFFLSQNYIQRNLPLIWLGIIILKSVELVTFCQNWSCISCKNLISHMTYLFYLLYKQFNSVVNSSNLVWYRQQEAYKTNVITMDTWQRVYSVIFAQATRKPSLPYTFEHTQTQFSPVVIWLVPGHFQDNLLYTSCHSSGMECIKNALKMVWHGLCHGRCWMYLFTFQYDGWNCGFFLGSLEQDER